MSKKNSTQNTALKGQLLRLAERCEDDVSLTNLVCELIDQGDQATLKSLESVLTDLCPDSVMECVLTLELPLNAAHVSCEDVAKAMANNFDESPLSTEEWFYSCLSEWDEE